MRTDAEPYLEQQAGLGVHCGCLRARQPEMRGVKQVNVFHKCAKSVASRDMFPALALFMQTVGCRGVRCLILRVKASGHINHDGTGR